MKKNLLLPLLAVIIISCENKKEQELNEREKAIALKEEQIALRETEYNELLHMRDSIFALKDTVQKSSDSINKWPDNLVKTWNSKILCRESNCNKYVIGDQLNEVWEFVADSTGMYANVLNNKKLTRVFKAKYSKDKILLEYTGDSISQNKSKINVVLDDIKQNVIKGTQSITGQDNCTAKFSVELTIPQKK